MTPTEERAVLERAAKAVEDAKTAFPYIRQLCAAAIRSLPLESKESEAEPWEQDAKRLALELECLLLDTKDNITVSRWWDSAHDALELHKQVCNLMYVRMK